MEIAKVNITHPEKILYPKLGVNKAEVANYYNFVAPYMLPLIKNRPLSLKHYPEGIDHPGFFHKHASKFYPDYIKRFPFPTSHHGVIEMVGITDAAGLVYLAGQNTIELHTALAKMNNIRKPDQLILDLDPSDDDFEKVRSVALIAKDILDQHDMQCYVKTTGSRGLHLHIPLKPKEEFDVIKKMSLQLAEHIQEQCPDLATVQFRKNKRGNLVFVDYLRNDYSATAIAPYSLRANEHAGIATPISWDEVRNNNKLKAYTYNIKNIQQRLTTIEDPWKDF